MLKHATPFLFALALVMLLSPLALADDPSAPATSPNSAALVGWCAFGYAVIGALVSVLRPDNTALPFMVPTSVRLYVALGGGIAEACLLGIVNGTPWAEAIAAAAVSAIAAFGTHGARVEPGATPAQAFAQKSHRPPAIDPATRGFAGLRALTCLTLLVASSFACGILRPGSAAEQLAGCEGGIALQHPDYSFDQYVAASLAACGKDAALTVLDVIQAIMDSHDPNVARYRAVARATRDDHARLGALRERVGRE